MRNLGDGISSRLPEQTWGGDGGPPADAAESPRLRLRAQRQVAVSGLSLVIALWMVLLGLPRSPVRWDAMPGWLGSAGLGSAANGFDANGSEGGDQETVGATAARFRSSRLDLNLATAAELQCLPNVGPQLSQRIVSHRDQVGGYQSVAELTDVAGVGPSRLESWKPFLFVIGEEAASDREDIQANRRTVSIAGTLPTSRRSTAGHRTVGSGSKNR